jgi:hypothetical protein
LYNINNKHEEARMTEYAQQYQGKDVVAVREAHAGDVGYVEGTKDQVTITLADGKEVTVVRSALSAAHGSKNQPDQPTPKPTPKM